MENNNWRSTKYSELTVEDGIMASLEGFYFVCNDGEVKAIGDTEDYI